MCVCVCVCVCIGITTVGNIKVGGAKPSLAYISLRVRIIVGTNDQSYQSLASACRT